MPADEALVTRTRGALWRFVAASYGVTWLLWIPVVLASFGVPSFSNPYVSTWFQDLVAFRATTPAHWLVAGGGILGPLSGALLAWHHRAGRAGVRALALHTFDLRISDVRGWLGALLPLGYFSIASAVLFALSGVAFLPAIGPVGFMGLLAAGCLVVAGEELGWRGTQLPLLQEGHSALYSSVVVAVTWACWHLPLLMMWRSGPGRSLVAAVTVLVPYLLLTIPMAVMHTFAFNTARGLVLVSIVLHGLHNHLNSVLRTPTTTSQEALAQASSLSDPVLLMVFWLAAIGLWLALGRRNLSTRPKVTATAMLRSISLSSESADAANETRV